MCNHFNVWFVSTKNCAEEILIDFQELVGKHTGENQAEAVWDTMKLYGLQGRVCSYLHFMNRVPHWCNCRSLQINCDNASDNDTMTEGVKARSLTHNVEFDAQEGHMRCMLDTEHLSAIEVSLPTKHMVSCLCKHNNNYLRTLATSSNMIRRSRSITKIQLRLLWTKALMLMLLDRMMRKKRNKTPLKCYWVFCQQSKRSGIFSWKCAILY